MYRVVTTNPGDILAVQGGGTHQSKSKRGAGDFKNLLGEAMQQDRGKATAKEKPTRQRPARTEPPTAQTDLQAGGNGLAAVGNQQPQIQVGESDGTQAAAAVAGPQTGVYTPPPVLAEILVMIPEEPQGGIHPQGVDILGVQTTVTEAEIDPALIVATETHLPTQISGAVHDPAGDRLGDMLGQAQQQLQGIAAPNSGGNGEPAPSGNSPEIAIDLESGLPMEPRDERTMPEKQVQSAPPTQAGTAGGPLPLQQPPLKELSKADQSVLEMQQTRELPETEEPVAVQPLSSQQPAAPARPAPVPQPAVPGQPAARTDQTEQIRIQVAENLENRRMEFNMQLQPEELGKINVKLVLEGGRLAVEIMAGSPQASQLLSRQSEALIQTLRMGANLEIQSVQVVTASDTASSHMDGAFNRMNGQSQGNSFAGSQTRQDGTGGDSPQQQESETAPLPETLLNTTI